MGDGSGYAQAVASVGVATIQALIAKNIADKQYAIAKTQMAIAQFVQDTWKYKHLPYELKLLAEVCTEPAYKAQYDLVTVRAGNDVAIAFSKSRAEQRRNMSIYAVGGFVALERQMGVAEALASTDAIAAARRREDGRVDIKKQQRIENQHRAIAMGRGLLDQSGAAMRAAAIGYSTGGATIAGAANSAGQLLGYLAGRDKSTGKTYDGEAINPSGASGVATLGAQAYSGDRQVTNGETPTGVTGKDLDKVGITSTNGAPPAPSDADINGFD